MLLYSKNLFSTPKEIVILNDNHAKEENYKA